MTPTLGHVPAVTSQQQLPVSSSSLPATSSDSSTLTSGMAGKTVAATKKQMTEKVTVRTLPKKQVCTQVANVVLSLYSFIKQSIWGNSITRLPANLNSIIYVNSTSSMCTLTECFVLAFVPIPSHHKYILYSCVICPVPLCTT